MLFYLMLTAMILNIIGIVLNGIRSRQLKKEWQDLEMTAFLANDALEKAIQCKEQAKKYEKELKTEALALALTKELLSKEK